MTIQYKFFTIPLKTTREVETELNHFLRSQRILTVHREFVSQGENSFWTMAVEYMSDGDTSPKDTGRKRVDYREILSPADFALFVKLRDWRKQVGEKEAVPVYTVFTMKIHSRSLGSTCERGLQPRPSRRDAAHTAPFSSTGVRKSLCHERLPTNNWRRWRGKRLHRKWN